MKSLIIKSVFLITIVGLFGLTVNAQSNDDLYYSPSSDSYQTPDYTTSEIDSEGNTIINNYYNEDKNDFDQFEDDFYYQSRIKRFNRNYAGFSYYAPVYTNTYFYTYNPYAWVNNIYYRPYYSRNWWNNGFSVNVGWNRGNNYYNNYNPFAYNSYNPYSYNPYSAYSAYSNPYGYNAYSPTAYNTYGAGYNPCNGAYVSNSYNTDNYYENTYYGTAPVRTTSNNNATPRAATNYGNQTTYDTYRPTSSYNNTDNNNVKSNNSSVPVYNKPSKTVTRPGNSNANPSKPAYSTPKSTTKPTYSTPKSTTKPTYSTPKSTTKPSYSTPKSTVRPSYSAPKSNTKPNNSRPSYSKPAQQSRPSYSAPKTNRTSKSIKSATPKSNKSYNNSSRPRSNSSKSYKSKKSNSSTKSLKTRRG